MIKCISMLRPWSVSAVALAVTVAVVGLLASQGDAGAAYPDGPSFNPMSDTELSDYNTNANADISSAFDLPEGDLQFSSNFNFTPPEFYVPEFEESGIPIGAKGAELSSLATLGLLNAACDTALNVSFDMYVATTDTGNTVGSDIAEEVCVDANSSGTVDCVDKYPEFLNDVFPGIQPRYRLCGCTNVSGTIVSMNFVIFDAGTNFGGEVGSFPDAYGYPSVTVLNNPAAPLAPSPITDFCSPLESDSVTFGLTEDNTTLDGDQGGYEQRRNPCAPGSYTFRTYALSSLDADGDGLENGLDTCPFHPNLDGDPRDDKGPDNDGIDSACDPDPDAACWPSAGGSQDDCEADGYMNRGDNCPMVANPLSVTYNYQEDPDGDGIGSLCEGDVSEEDLGMPPIDGCADADDSDGDTVVNDGCPAEGAAEDVCDEERLTCADADGSPPWDACDDDGDTKINDGCPVFGFGDPDEPDGDREEVLLEQVVEIEGDDVCCDEEVDADCDGWDDETEEQYGSDPDDPDSTPEDALFDEEFDQESCTDGEDNDLDGATDGDDEGCAEATATPTPTPTAVPAELDTDGDGFEDTLEIELGSDPDDAESTPENVAVEGTCTDGVDNDGDGVTDDEDEGCAATPTETATPEVEVEYCDPGFPGTYNGLVRIDGVPAASGYEVVATIDGIEWGSAFVTGGRYAMDIPASCPVSPPCFEGGTLTFTIDGMPCTPSAEFAAGLQNLDLDCTAPEAPPTVAPPEPTEPSTPVATPTAVETPTATVTPAQPPPSGSGGMGTGSPMPLWAIALLSWAGLMGIAGVGILVRR